MGATASGLPWPAGTELVRDGDDAIRALAEAVEARMWAPGAHGVKYRFYSGAYTTGTDGRVWIAVPGLAVANNGLGAILGFEKWIARPVQTSGASILWEVTTLAGATVNSTSMTFSITAWGT